MTLKQRFFIFLQYILPQHGLSRVIGYFAESQTGWLKNALIKGFIKRYKVDMSLALHKNASHYKHFNDFFTRPLKEDVRPIAEGENTIVCPADGVISQLGKVEYGRIFQAKGHNFSLCELLGGDSQRAHEFMNGHFCTIYLSPRDYHRVHMPAAGTLREMIYVPGRLFSVNPGTAEHVPELFSRNERVVCIFDTDKGPMAVVLVGAMVVASIETVWAGLVTPVKRLLRTFSYTEESCRAVHLEKGAELGRFKLGSTVIVLFGPKQTDWLTSLGEQSAVNMGQELGLFTDSAMQTP